MWESRARPAQACRCPGREQKLRSSGAMAAGNCGPVELLSSYREVGWPPLLGTRPASVRSCIEPYWKGQVKDEELPGLVHAGRGAVVLVLSHVFLKRGRLNPPHLVADEHVLCILKRHAAIPELCQQSGGLQVGLCWLVPHGGRHFLRRHVEARKKRSMGGGTLMLRLQVVAAGTGTASKAREVRRPPARGRGRNWQAMFESSATGLRWRMLSLD